MNITVGAKCWDGQRMKSLEEIVKVEGLPIVEQRRFVERFKLKLGDPDVKAAIGYSIPLALLASGLPPFGATRTFAKTVAGPEVVPAALTDGIKSTVLHVFDPLIDLIQALAYPIAGVMIAGGCLFVMVGNRDRGMSMLQNAAIGYILVQLSPMLLKLLVGVGEAI